MAAKDGSVSQNDGEQEHLHSQHNADPAEAAMDARSRHLPHNPLSFRQYLPQDACQGDSPNRLGLTKERRNSVKDGTSGWAVVGAAFLVEIPLRPGRRPLVDVRTAHLPISLLHVLLGAVRGLLRSFEFRMSLNLRIFLVDLRSRLDGLLALAPETDRPRQLRSLRRVGRRHHRIIVRQAPLGAVLVRREAVG